MRTTLLAAVGVMCAACATARAPTTRELDRRSGLLSADDGGQAPPQLLRLSTSTALARAPMMPVKVPPLIEKVWVSDLALAPDARLQGTWMYVEVERGRWLDEVDPGGAPLIDLSEGAHSHGPSAELSTSPSAAPSQAGMQDVAKALGQTRP